MTKERYGVYYTPHTSLWSSLFSHWVSSEFEVRSNFHICCCWALGCILVFIIWDHVILRHYTDVIMGAITSQISSLTIVYSTVYSDADQRKHQSSASRAFVWGIHRWPVNSPRKWPVTQKMVPFDDVIMTSLRLFQFRPSLITVPRWGFFSAPGGCSSTHGFFLQATAFPMLKVFIYFYLNFPEVCAFC